MKPQAPTPPDDDLFSGRIPILEALQKLRLRLLDLTSRNRLLNFRHSPGKSIQFVDAQPNPIFKKLMESSDRKIILKPIPEPHRSECKIVADRLTRPDVKDYARTHGIPTSFELPPADQKANSASAIQTLFYPDDLERHCRKFQKEMKSAIDETGAHMLFLIFGFLDFPERSTTIKTLTAPLISVPVLIEKGDLDRDTRHYRYHLSYTGEELTENLSLKEKLRQDHGFDLPVFNEDESAPEDYFSEIQRVIGGGYGWSLKRQMTLALLSFTRMLLVRDIDPSSWPRFEDGSSSLVDHSIIRMVFEGAGGNGNKEGTAGQREDYNIDDHPQRNIPLIYDADSSQHSALIDALAGHNMVIQGPPGTGKSQTITNLIAGGIAEGKKILFLSEKMAALEVVKKRLSLAGLDDFCLELHSNRTNKKQVLDAIAARMNKHYPLPNALGSQLRALEDKRKDLKAYVDLINSVTGNAQGLTIHSVLWKAERLRSKCADEWKNARELIIPKAHELTSAEFDSLYDTVVHTCNQYSIIGVYGPTHAFWDFLPTELMPGADLSIERIMQETLPLLKSFKSSFEEMALFLNKKAFHLDPEKVNALLSSLAAVKPDKCYPGMSRNILPQLFTSNDPAFKNREKTLSDLDEKLARVRRLRSDFQGRLNKPDTLTQAIGEEAEKLQKSLPALLPMDKSCKDAGDLANVILQTGIKVRTALDEIKKCGQLVGINFDGSDRSIEKIRTIIDISSDAPRYLLKYRHPGLQRPDAKGIIEKAKAQLRDIKNEEGEISKILYSDMIPSETEIKLAILVLREGDAWYRIFQRRWRQACRIHRVCDIAKTRKTGTQRLKELERLMALGIGKTEWRSNQTYKDVLGPLYQGEDTSFHEAIQLVSWLDSAGNRLNKVGLDNYSYDFYRASEARIFEIAQSQSKIDNAISIINGGLNSLKMWINQSTAASKEILDATNWFSFADQLDKMGAFLRDAADKLLAWSPENVLVAESLQAVTSHVALPKAIKAVDEDVKARLLLGKEFRSTETDIKPAWESLLYGRCVLLQNMPQEINHCLLSSDVDSKYDRITEYTKAIHDGWINVDKFRKQLAAFAQFDIQSWVGKKFNDAEFPSLLVARTEAAINSMDTLLPWVQYLQQRERARARGLGDFIELLESGTVGPVHLPHMFGYRFYGSIASNLFRKHPILGQFAGTRQEAIRDEFARIDRDTIKLRGAECAHHAASRCSPPLGTGGARVDDKTELTLLNYLITQVRPRMPVRKLMRKAGSAIQALKPCFMMGPQAVAQFLEPDGVGFDMVVMDEASQLKPEEALGAIARGAQLIVVGDPNQLPPTTFFDRLSLTSEDGDDDGQQVVALDSQSILDICTGHFKHTRTLQWHYRSRHESLIAFSNHHFYKNLFIFPSPYPKGRLLGVHSHYIRDGVYHDQMNLVEAKRVTDAVIDHMMNHPTDSLGVVTLNLKQRDLIDEMLEQRFRNLDKTEKYRNDWAREGMGFFVKNLENVQGDERDVIFISTTFGKASGTKVVRQNFGPVSRGDGWRRLNVLFTRARKAVHLFTSMQPEDVIVDANTPAGTKTLHDYLEYARSGILTDIAPSGGEPESDFEVAVADMLRSHNFEVVPQLGVAGFRIDLAVRHPNYQSGFLAAIECDGATYHSGTSVRDRDRIRQEILEGLGWKDRIWRIWSTDWFRNPMRETANLIAFLNKLKNTPLDGAYFVEPDVAFSDEVAPVFPVEQLTLENLGVAIVKTEDDEQEIEVGDTVTYFPANKPDHEIKVLITENENNPDKMIISTVNPLAQVMLGAMVGQSVTLKDRRGERVFNIKSIAKASRY